MSSDLLHMHKNKKSKYLQNKIFKYECRNKGEEEKIVPVTKRNENLQLENGARKERHKT